MQSLQMIQHLDAASVVVALLALPWLTVMLMHAVGAQYRASYNDSWNARAGAAVRWARVAIVQGPASAGSVIKFASRRAARTGNAHSQVLHAA